MTCHGSRHDAEQEAIEQAQLAKHMAGDCEGPPVCGWCMDAQELGEESLGG